MKQINPDPSEAVRSRICVLFPGTLGDFVCFLPALQALVRDADVDLFARSKFADIVPGGVAVRSLECNEITRLFAPDDAEDQRLRNVFGAYAAVYSWLGSQQNDFVRRLQSFSCGTAQVFPFRPSDDGTHQIDYYLSSLRLDGAVSRQPVVGLRPEGIAWFDHFRARHEFDGRPALVIAPGSGAREKNWPEEFFLAVVEWWRRVIGGVVVVVTGPVEEERGGTERLRRSCLPASDLSLTQVAALLAGSELYLGHDSGITHLAAAVGTRTIALFGPSNARQWAPRGKRVTVVSRNIECSPCRIGKMKSCPHRACLTELHPAEVIDVMGSLPEVITLTRVGAGIKV